MKKILIGIAIASVATLFIVVFMYISRQTITTGTINEPTLPPSQPPMTKEEQCRKNIQSDNNLYEDRMAKAVKTCNDTQICTYNDFRMWSGVNGSFVPDWRSEDYMNIKIQECLIRWPTDTPEPTISLESSPISPFPSP